MNYMKQVADMLGVQFGEWFEIRESWGDKKVLGEGRLSRLGLEEKNRGLAGACLPEAGCLKDKITKI